MDLSCGNDTKCKDQIWPCPLIFWPKNPKRYFWGRGQYICEVSLLYAKSKWNCGAETVKSLKSKFDLWPFDPKSIEVLLRSRSIVSSLYVKWKRSYCSETTFSQTDRQMDRQTAMVKPVYLHNFVGGGIQTYFNVEKSLKNDPPPLEVKISWGESLFHDLWFKI